MKVLLDTSAAAVEEKVREFPGLVCGQLLTPLTRYLCWSGEYAIDNGAFSKFDCNAFLALLNKQRPECDRCLFVAAPDVVGSGRRTLETFDHWYPRLCAWPVALVAQDGIEDLPIPWDDLAYIFVGGTTEWKMSKAAADVVKCARAVGVRCHIGRVNTVRRFRYFEELGADTCDGSGLSRYDWMLQALSDGSPGDTPLFDGMNGGVVVGGASSTQE